MPTRRGPRSALETSLADDGANAAITKPQMVRLVEILDQLLAGSDTVAGPTEAEMLLAVD